MSYNTDDSLPEDVAFAIFKQAQQSLPWQLALARRLAQLRRGARGLAAFKDLVTRPWGQAQIVPQEIVQRREMM